MTLITVVIPAHDEESIIRRALLTIRDGAGGDIEVLVVANGCSDGTAARSREVDGVQVIEICEASKIAALNAGSHAASGSPIAFVDADVSVRGADLLELGRRIESDESARWGRRVCGSCHPSRGRCDSTTACGR